MQHDSCRYWRVGISGICAMAIMLLSACSTYVYQSEKGHEAYQDRRNERQIRLNQMYRLREELRIGVQQDFSYLPYSASCEDGPQAVPCPMAVKLPVGTIIELVGINEYHHVNRGAWYTLIFAVHDYPELDTLLFQWNDRKFSALLRQRSSRIELMRGDSRWTAERVAKIADAGWARKHRVNVRKLVVAPRNTDGTADLPGSDQHGSISVREVGWDGSGGLVEIEDNQHGYSFVLPSGWTAAHVPGSTELDKARKDIVFRSGDGSATLRLAHWTREQGSLIERIRKQASLALGATTKEEIKKVDSHIKSLGSRELKEMNVESGYELRVTSGEWGKEGYLLGVQKGDDLFLFFLAAKSEFPEGRPYRRPRNPTVTLPQSLWFAGTQRD